MWHDEHCVQFNFKFSQCNLLDESTTNLDTPSTRRTKTKKKDQIEEQQITQPIDVFEENVSLRIPLFILKDKCHFLVR
jgi:hypothetical protein